MALHFPLKARVADAICLTNYFVFTLGHCVNFKAVIYESTSFIRAPGFQISYHYISSLNVPEIRPLRAFRSTLSNGCPGSNDHYKAVVSISGT